MENLNSLSKKELIALILQLQQIVAEQAEMLALAFKEIEALKKGMLPPKTPPDWAKPNKPQKPDAQENMESGSQIESEKDSFQEENDNSNSSGKKGKERKKRKKSFPRKRLQPTETVEHVCNNCPDCGRKLSGGWLYSLRQIIEIPPIVPRVIDHIITARKCGVCNKTCVPKVDYSEETIEHSPYGLHLVSFITYLRTLGRLPMESIKDLLQTLMGLHLSVGQISELLHLVAKQGQETYTKLRDEIRGSPYVHADETGWREDGQNGYIWSFSNPHVRYYVYDKSRSHFVPESVLGSLFPGILVSDFYAAYNYHNGLHQRCWVHLWRDVHDLKKAHPDAKGVHSWAEKLRDIYDRAKAFSSSSCKLRAKARVAFQKELYDLCSPYEKAELPQSTLCKRMLQFEAEMFTFVEYPDVPSENNAAERSVRPRVIARKISGGTRSSKGSKTMAVNASLFATWRLRGKDCLEECRQMLISSQKPMATPAS